MHRDGGVDQVAAKGLKANQDAIFIRTRKPRVADHVGQQNRGQFPGLAHGLSPRPDHWSQVAGAWMHSMLHR
jgi:hypothetical protein